MSRSPQSGEESEYEETYESVREEGDINRGDKLIKIDKITLKKSVKEVKTPLKVKIVEEKVKKNGSAKVEECKREIFKTSSILPSPLIDRRTMSKERLQKMSRTPSTERVDSGAGRSLSRTPSDERLLLSYPTNGSVSKSSSVGSLENLRRTPSRERVDVGDASSGSGTGSSKGEWYHEYRTQSFHNYNSKFEKIHSKQEYDSHIAEIKGKC